MALDPSLRTTPESTIVAELDVHRQALQSQMSTMTAGIHCNAKALPFANQIDIDVVGVGPTTVWLGCADIYTGTNEIHIVDWTPTSGLGDYQTWYNNTIPPMLDTARRNVASHQPLFQLQAMIDTLYFYGHGGQFDLAQQTGTIQPVWKRSLCLDLTPDTHRTELGTCKVGTLKTQQWVYDRQAQLIHNPATSGCLAALAESSAPRVAVGSVSCNGEDPAQQWTYDPQGKVLTSGVGTVLDVQDGALQAGQNVWLWPRGVDDHAQQWGTSANYTVFSHGVITTSSQNAKGVSWVVGSDGGLYTRTFPDPTGAGDTPITGTGFAPPGSAVAAASPSSGTIDAFVAGNDGKVYVTSQTGTGPWQSPSPLTPGGLAPPGAPLAATTLGRQLAVFFVDNHGAVQTLTFDPVFGWLGPVRLTGTNYAPARATLAAGMRASGELDVFAIGSDGGLKYMAFAGGLWTGPWPLTLGGYAPPGAPVATAVDVNGFLNVFSIGNDGAVNTKWDCTALWCGNTALSATGFAPSSGNLSAINFNNQSMNLFVVDNQNNLDVLSNSGLGWQGPTAIGPDLADPGASTSTTIEGTSQLDVFVVSGAATSGVVELTNTSGTWSSPIPLN